MNDFSKLQFYTKIDQDDTYMPAFYIWNTANWAILEIDYQSNI